MNEAALLQVRAYSQAGGEIMLGTNVGYIDQFDRSEDTWMSRVGMSFQQILASLTTNPRSASSIPPIAAASQKGWNADLVVLRTEPEHDAAAFSKVHYTILSEMIIYSEK